MTGISDKEYDQAFDGIEQYDPFWDYLRYGKGRDWQPKKWDCKGLANNLHDIVTVKGSRCNICGTDKSVWHEIQFRQDMTWAVDCRSLQAKQDDIRAAGRRLAEIMAADTVPAQDPYTVPAGDVIPDELENTKDWRIYINHLKAGDWHGLEYGDFVLPGFGTSKQSCGNWVLEGCIGSGKQDQDLRTRAEIAQDKEHSNGGVARRKILTCKKISCLVCVESSVRRAAMKAAERMTAFMILMQSDVYKDHKTRIFNHFLVSPKSDQYYKLRTLAGIKEYEKTILKELKKLGIDGGVMVFHPFRFTKGLGRPYFNPHWHFILSGYTLPDDIEAAHERHGAVFMSIRTMSDSRNAYAVMKYLLSHTAQMKDPNVRFDTVRYFGLAQNRYFKTESILRAASEYPDTLSGITDYITGVEYLRKRAKYARARLTFKRVRVQRFTFRDNILDLKNTIHTRDEVLTDAAEIKAFFLRDDKQVIDYTRYMKIRSDIDGTWEDTKDNLAIPKSASNELIVMAIDAESIRYVPRIDPDTGKSIVYSEKCEHRNYFVFHLDPDDTKLCPMCRRKIQNLTANKPENPVWQELDLDYFLPVMPQDVHYTAHYDVWDGLQYYTDKGPQRDKGMQVRNQFYQDFRPDIKMPQLQAVRDSIQKMFTKEIKTRIWKDKNRKATVGEIDDYLITMLHVKGVPEWDDGKQDLISPAESAAGKPAESGRIHSDTPEAAKYRKRAAAAAIVSGQSKL